jgi:uncharacterized protein YndB with AHSA1/START domain
MTREFALSVEQVIAAPARPGGHWSVSFQVPDGPAFREERVITALERPGLLAYDMRAIYPDAPGFATMVEVTIAAVTAGAATAGAAAAAQRIRLTQRGFPREDDRNVFAAAWQQVLGGLAARIGLPG